MAFTRSWNEAEPDGSENASDIDLIIRQLKVDLRERLEDVSSFGTDTDPMTLKASALDAGTTGVIARYNADNGAGSKVVDEAGGGSTLHVRILGTTDASGDISLDLSEFSDNLRAWTGQNISGDPVPGPIVIGVMRNSAGGVQQYHIVVSDVVAAPEGTTSPAGTITFRVFDTAWAAVASTSGINFGVTYGWV